MGTGPKARQNCVVQDERRKPLAPVVVGPGRGSSLYATQTSNRSRFCLVSAGDSLSIISMGGERLLSGWGGLGLHRCGLGVGDSRVILSPLRSAPLPSTGSAALHPPDPVDSPAILPVASHPCKAAGRRPPSSPAGRADCPPAPTALLAGRPPYPPACPAPPLQDSR